MTQVSLSSAQFVAQPKKDIQAFPKIRIKHPFLEAVCDGAATLDQIRAWAIQDYQFRAAVPRIAMLRYLACSDAEGTFGPAAAALGHGPIKQYDMKPDDVRFFTVYAEADEEHGSLAEEIAERYNTSPHLQEQTRKHMSRRIEPLNDIWSTDGF